MKRQTAGQSIRGGAEVLTLKGVPTEKVVNIFIDRTRDAGSLINNIKIPAVLFAGFSLSGIYRTFGHPCSPVLRMAYLTLNSLSFSMHVSSVFLATLLSARLIGGGFDPVETSASNLLVKYFELSYTGTISSFFAGILLFFLSNTVCAYLTFGPTPEAMVVCVINAVCSFLLLCSCRTSLVNYDTVPALILRFLQLMMEAITKTKIQRRHVLYAFLTFGLSYWVHFVSSQFQESLKQEARQ